MAVSPLLVPAARTNSRHHRWLVAQLLFAQHSQVVVDVLLSVAHSEETEVGPSHSLRGKTGCSFGHFRLIEVANISGAQFLMFFVFNKSVDLTIGFNDVDSGNVVELVGLGLILFPDERSPKVVEGGCIVTLPFLKLVDSGLEEGDDGVDRFMGVNHLLMEDTALVRVFRLHEQGQSPEEGP